MFLSVAHKMLGIDGPVNILLIFAINQYNLIGTTETCITTLELLS